MSFKNRCTISSSYEFQAHQQRSQRRCCFSQNALLWFEVLPDAHRFVAGAPRCSAMQRDLSPGRQAACNSPSEGMRFRQSRQSCPEHPGVSDGIPGCCWCDSGSTPLTTTTLRRTVTYQSTSTLCTWLSWCICTSELLAASSFNMVMLWKLAYTRTEYSVSWTSISCSPGLTICVQEYLSGA